jgi:hypothetical protein
VHEFTNLEEGENMSGDDPNDKEVGFGSPKQEATVVALRGRKNLNATHTADDPEPTEEAVPRPVYQHRVLPAGEVTRVQERTQAEILKEIMCQLTLCMLSAEDGSLYEGILQTGSATSRQTGRTVRPHIFVHSYPGGKTSMVPVSVIRRVYVPADTKDFIDPEDGTSETPTRYTNYFDELVRTVNRIPQKEDVPLDSSKQFYYYFSRLMQSTFHCTSDVELCFKADYRGIVAMGEKALPYIFTLLVLDQEAQPEVAKGKVANHRGFGFPWGMALSAITGENPVGRAHIKCVDDWVVWGKEHGHITSET